MFLFNFCSVATNTILNKHSCDVSYNQRCLIRVLVIFYLSTNKNNPPGQSKLHPSNKLLSKLIISLPRSIAQYDWLVLTCHGTKIIADKHTNIYYYDVLYMIQSSRANNNVIFYCVYHKYIRQTDNPCYSVCELMKTETSS